MATFVFADRWPSHRSRDGGVRRRVASMGRVLRPRAVFGCPQGHGALDARPGQEEKEMRQKEQKGQEPRRRRQKRWWQWWWQWQWAEPASFALLGLGLWPRVAGLVRAESQGLPLASLLQRLQRRGELRACFLPPFIVLAPCKRSEVFAVLLLMFKPLFFLNYELL